MIPPLPMQPTFDVVIATQGRATLARCLESIASQEDAAGFETMVIADTHGPLLCDVQKVVESFGRGFRYDEHDGGLHAKGHPQAMFAMSVCRADWMLFQGDDDIYLPCAFSAIKQAVSKLPETMPILARIVGIYGQTIWEYPGQLRPGRISAQCIIAPNVPDKLGTWPPTDLGDYAFIRKTVSQWDRKAHWLDHVIVQCRP